MKVNRTLKVQQELWDEAMKKAHKLERSLSGQIRHFLRKFIEDEH